MSPSVPVSSTPTNWVPSVPWPRKRATFASHAQANIVRHVQACPPEDMPPWQIRTPSPACAKPDACMLASLRQAKVKWTPHPTEKHTEPQSCCRIHFSGSQIVFGLCKFQILESMTWHCKSVLHFPWNPCSHRIPIIFPTRIECHPSLVSRIS